MRKLFSSVMASALILLLVACMIPGTFKARYTLEKNGQYSMKYDGTMVNMLAKIVEYEPALKGQSLPPQDKKDVEEVVKLIEHNTRTKSFKSLGDNTYKVIMEENGNIKEQERAHFPNAGEGKFWTLAYNKQDNTVSFTIGSIQQNDLDFLKELAMVPSGEISFATDLNLVSSTTELKKSFFGNTYTVTINDDILKEGLTILWSLE